MPPRPKSVSRQMYTYRIGCSQTIRSLAIRTTRRALSSPTDAVASCAPSPGCRTAALALRADRRSSSLNGCRRCTKPRGGVLRTYGNTHENCVRYAASLTRPFAVRQSECSVLNRTTIIILVSLRLAGVKIKIIPRRLMYLSHSLGRQGAP